MPYSFSVRILHRNLVTDCEGGEVMNVEKLLTALLLLLPGLSWAPPALSEPSMLPLLAAGGVVAIAVKFMKRKR
jgi:hypothetical protein